MNTQKSETFLKAKELVEAISDIDAILGDYNYGVKVPSEKNDKKYNIFTRLYRRIHGIRRDYNVYRSQFSSHFVVRLVEFLADLRAKYEEDLRHLS